MSDKSGMKSIKEVQELDRIINTYVHRTDNPSYVGIQKAFWKAIDAIQKAVNNLDESHPQPESDELQERINDLEEQLEQKTKAASDWARKAMEAGNQRSELQRELEKLKSQPEAQPEPIKEAVETFDMGYAYNQAIGFAEWLELNGYKIKGWDQTQREVVYNEFLKYQTQTQNNSQ